MCWRDVSNAAWSTSSSILIKCLRVLRINKIISAGFAPPLDVLSPPDWMNYSTCFWRLLVLRVISSVFSPQFLPTGEKGTFFCRFLNGYSSSEFLAPLPSAPVWNNVVSKQRAALCPFLQTPLLPASPRLLPSLQTCKAFFFSPSVHSAHSPLLLPAEVIFCHCGLFDHLTHLMLTVSTQRERDRKKKALLCLWTSFQLSQGEKIKKINSRSGVF